MDRRTFMKVSGAAVAGMSLGAPAFAQSARSRTLIFVPSTGLSILDPVVNTGTSTIGHAYCVFDTLYGIDSNYRPQPQMAEGHTTSDDGLTWTIKLRPGLKFHDGTPVLARDCVASITRWWKRDSFGASLASYTDVVEAADDQTIRFRLKRPFGVLLDALAHPHTSPCMIMPERLAVMDAMKPVPEIVGSGPYQFVKDEFVAGSKAVYTKFAGYVPRQEKPDTTAGAKLINFDRLEWRTISDAGTASPALINGEIDWWEIVPPDLIPLVKNSQTAKLSEYDPLGFTSVMRMNMIQPPFNNPKLRQLVLEGVVQADYNRSMMGDELAAQKNCYAFFQCGLPGVKEVAEKLMSPAKNYARLAEEVKKAGYKGEKVVVMNAVDVSLIAPLGEITADVLRKMGFNVELQSMDWQTLITRRASKEATDKGGWSVFHASSVASTLANPLVNILTRGMGANGYAGWWDSPEMERLVVQWIGNRTDAEREKTVAEIQALLLDQVPILPLGNFIPQTGLRKEITGHLPGPVPIPWNFKRV